MRLGQSGKPPQLVKCLRSSTGQNAGLRNRVVVGSNPTGGANFEKRSSETMKQPVVELSAARASTERRARPMVRIHPFSPKNASVSLPATNRLKGNWNM